MFGRCLAFIREGFGLEIVPRKALSAGSQIGGGPLAQPYNFNDSPQKEARDDTF